MNEKKPIFPRISIEKIKPLESLLDVEISLNDFANLFALSDYHRTFKILLPLEEAGLLSKEEIGEATKKRTVPK